MGPCLGAKSTAKGHGLRPSVAILAQGISVRGHLRSFQRKGSGQRFWHTPCQMLLTLAALGLPALLHTWSHGTAHDAAAVVSRHTSRGAPSVGRSPHNTCNASKLRPRNALEQQLANQRTELILTVAQEREGVTRTTKAHQARLPTLAAEALGPKVTLPHKQRSHHQEATRPGVSHGL